MEKYITGTGQLVYVHDRERCKGRHCVIHNPSNHRMKDWPTHWRDDRGLMERICPCGVGHPDPDDLAYKAIYLRQLGKSESEILATISTESTHGCCGCCTGKKFESQEDAEERIKKT